MANNTKVLMSLLVGIVLLVVALPSGVAAKGQSNVAATLHNFNSTARDWQGNDSQYQMNTTEICVFCHTPHGGSLTGPLWNRANPTAAWQHYDSQTLGSYLGGLATNRALNAESLMCMSCHDGSITPAINHVINSPNYLPPLKSESNTDMTIIGFPGNALIGGSQANPFDSGDLRDDHPISFSYHDVYYSSDYQATGAKSGQLHSPGAAKTASGEGVRFFGPTGVPGGDRVECSTCHDPHVEYGDYSGMTMDYAPFLIMKNAGSNLCLACHNK